MGFSVDVSVSCEFCVGVLGIWVVVSERRLNDRQRVFSPDQTKPGSV